MYFKVFCQYCGQRLRASAVNVGTRSSCPSCCEPFTVPEPPSSLPPATPPLAKTLRSQKPPPLPVNAAPKPFDPYKTPLSAKHIVLVLIAIVLCASLRTHILDQLKN